jgi:similar to stage IV sporulation protein
MKEMNRLNRYKRGIITIEIQSHIPERFINLLWKNNVNIKNIRKKNIATMVMDINLSDFRKIEDIAHKTNTKIKVIGRRGITFFMLKIRRRVALAGGIVLFVFILYYLSNFIWKVEIHTENYMAPYEIRQQLESLGISPGTKKSSINVYELQDKMIKNNANIMYFRARIEGSKLVANVVEKVTAPNIISETTPCNLVAKKDGQVVRVYTTAGTALVKNGDIVKTGQVIVKGEQGKEGNTYSVHASGVVVARTFYEESKEVVMNGSKKERTGNIIANMYLEVAGKRLYLKNSLNKFKSYDKIVENSGFLKKEFYYETNETKFNLQPETVIQNTADELYSKIAQSLDKSVKIIDKKIYSDLSGDNLRVRVLVTAEENIAITEKLQ